MELLATTIAGFENIAIREVGELIGVQAQQKKLGMIGFPGELDDIFTLNYTSKSLHRIFLLLRRSTFSQLSDIYQIVREISYQPYIEPDQSFGIRSQRHGEHDFTSIDVAREAGQAVIDSYREETGVRLKVDLDDPDVILRAEVRNDQFWIGIDTTGNDSLHKRGYRVYQHHAPLKATLSYCLLQIAEWSEAESLLDPFCGSGTISIEAAHWARKIPNRFRGHFAFQKLRFLDHDRFREMKAEIDSQLRHPQLRISGCDLFKRQVQGALQNARRAEVEVDFFRGDATKVPLNYDKLVTNPPYGLRVANKRITRELYQAFARNLERWEWKRAVILTGAPKLFESRYLSRKMSIMYGSLPAVVLVLDRR